MKMNININNRVLGGLLVLLLATAAIAANTVYATSLVLKSTTGDLLLQADGDTDDYLAISTESNVPYIHNVGGSTTRFSSTDDSAGLPTKGYAQLSFGGGDARLGLYSNDSQSILMFADAPLQGNFLQSIGGHFYIQTQNSKNIIFNSDGNQIKPQSDDDTSLGVAGARWSDIRSVLVNGADICFENEVCMTECENNLGQLDICFVYGKPTRNQAKKIALSAFNTFADYQQSHLDTDGNYDNTLTENEFDTYKAETTTANGNLDFTFGRPVKMTLRDVKNGLDRLDAIESSLCNQGLNQYC